PLSFMISLGRMGRMMPKPMASTRTVMKMKTTLPMTGRGGYHGPGQVDAGQIRSSPWKAKPPGRRIFHRTHREAPMLLRRRMLDCVVIVSCLGLCLADPTAGATLTCDPPDPPPRF